MSKSWSHNSLSRHRDEVDVFNKQKESKACEFGRQFQIGRIEGNFVFSTSNYSIRMPDALTLKPMVRTHLNTLPVLVIGRLAIDENYHNKGLGSALLRDAMIRSINIAQDAGVFAILIHSLSDKAKQFYISRGIVESPLQPMTLFMTLATIRIILTEEK